MKPTFLFWRVKYCFATLITSAAVIRATFWRCYMR